MSSLTTQQYLSLSQFISNDFSPSDVNNQLTIAQILSDPNREIEHNNEPVLDGLATIGDWKLINFESNTTSGFAAAAFQSPTGEIVFALRGTEPNLFSNPTEALKDFESDLEIATDTNSASLRLRLLRKLESMLMLTQKLSAERVTLDLSH